MESLIISEKFYSIQGEGITMGIPAVFLRLAGCNILCKSEHWICDTIEVWRKGVKTPFDEVLDDDHVKRLIKKAHLVITGGEPLLHQKNIVKYVNWFIMKHQFKPIIEVETNGTILPIPELMDLVDYWNCSPKLSTSGEKYNKRFNEVSLNHLNRLNNTIFKFVISTEADIEEILQEYYFLDFSKFVFMPSGDSQELLNDSRLLVAEKCIELGIKYCDRLHVVIWNKKTGV